MPQEKAEAHVLRWVDYGDTSRIVTFLTPCRGRLACIAKGVRRKNSPLAAILDTMNRVELVYYWKDGRAVQTLAEASLLDGYGGVKADLERTAFAAFPLELAAKVAHENEPSSAFYRALSQGLSGLNVWEGNARAHCCWQAARLLSAAGFQPELARCVQCGQAISDNPGFNLEGGVTCAECRADRSLSQTALRGLRAMFSAEDRCPAIDAPVEIFRIIRAYAVRQTESSYNSLRVLEEMFP